MTEQHPITPPPELFKQWEGMPRSLAFEAAYRAGADAELEACLIEVGFWAHKSLAENVRAIRRPKLLSLAEDALMLIFAIEQSQDPNDAWDFTIIREALERLKELEQN